MSKLTQMAKGKECIRCGGHDAYACHYNGQRQHQYGKGRGIKAHDLASAEFCHACDQLFSEGNFDLWGYTNEDYKTAKSEEFLHWIMMTNIRRYKSGALKDA